MAGMSQDALLGQLSPLWHLAIGGCVLVTDKGGEQLVPRRPDLIEIR